MTDLLALFICHALGWVRDCCLLDSFIMITCALCFYHVQAWFRMCLDSLSPVYLPCFGDHYCMLGSLPPMLLQSCDDHCESITASNVDTVWLPLCVCHVYLQAPQPQALLSVVTLFKAATKASMESNLLSIETSQYLLYS